MKTKLALLRGVVASLLLTLGLTSLAERLDPIMDNQPNQPLGSDMAVAADCTASCAIPDRTPHIS